jgi:hypothetical protein
MSTIHLEKMCACGFDRAREDLRLQLTGREVLIPPSAPGRRAVLRACRGCRTVYAVAEEEYLMLPLLGRVLAMTDRGPVLRSAEEDQKGSSRS